MAKKVYNVAVKVKTDYAGRPVESIETMLRRFKKKLEKENTLYDMRKHDYYVPKSVKSKLKSKLARQRVERERRKKEKYLNAKADK